VSRSREPAHEKAYRELKDRILTMKLRPGDTIAEASLADELGVSRTPVRAAINRLEQEGLIQSEKRRKRVYILTIHEVQEIFDLKIAIEARVARLAAERGRDAHKREMQDILERMHQFSQNEFNRLNHDHALIQEWLVIDRSFHHLLFSMAQNRRAEQMVDNLNIQWHRLQLGILAMEGRLRQNVEEHVAIGDAVAAGEAEKAESLMIDHFEKLHHTIRSIMEVFHFPD